MPLTKAVLNESAYNTHFQCTTALLLTDCIQHFPLVFSLSWRPAIVYAGMLCVYVKRVWLKLVSLLHLNISSKERFYITPRQWIVNSISQGPVDFCLYLDWKAYLKLYMLGLVLFKGPLYKQRSSQGHLMYNRPNMYNFKWAFRSRYKQRSRGRSLHKPIMRP
jgi:hypothetical protein